MRVRALVEEKNMGQRQTHLRSLVGRVWLSSAGRAIQFSPERTFLLAHVIHETTDPSGLASVDEDLCHWNLERHGGGPELMG